MPKCPFVHMLSVDTRVMNMLPSILRLCPHFHLNDTQLFLDLWVARWASFRLSFSKASLLNAASHFQSTVCWCADKRAR